jgi:hypothetical protein
MVPPVLPSPGRLRTLAALLALVWLGSPAWPQQIDDQFITLAFAHRFAETGQLRWGTGEVVEASSSFLQLVLATIAAAAGLDTNLFVKLLAALCGAGIVAFAGSRLPRGIGGGLLLAALVSWEPMGWWSFAGMETTLFALLLLGGWVGVLTGAPVAGLGALWLAATAHPEGNAHFALGAALVALRGPRRTVLPFVLALVAWHTLRTAYFGAFFPTPYLVKIAGNPPFGDQWHQVGLDLVSAVGIGAVLLGVFPLRRPVVLLPLLLQIAVALRAEADWMGHARQILPGLLATAVAWAVTSTPRPLGRATRALLVGVVAGAAWIVPPYVLASGLEIRSAAGLASPLTWLRSAFDTTQDEDVVWIVENAPPHGRVMLEDVGMPGNIADIGIIDLAGLTDRLVALAWIDDRYDAALKARFQVERPDLVRRMGYASDEASRPVPWLRLPAPRRVVYAQGTALLYTLSSVRPDPETVLARWAALHARYPSQGPLTWHYATALAASGRLPEAGRVAETAATNFPADPMLQALPASLFSPFPFQEFQDAPVRLRQTSRAIPRSVVPELGVRLLVEPADAKGQLVTLRWDCGGPVQTVRVVGSTVVPLPTFPCEAPHAALRVEAVDDRPRRTLGEWMTVGLVAWR